MNRTVLPIALAVLAAAAPAAHADDRYSIDLSAPSSALLGQPLVIEASGVNPPPSEWWELAWIQVAAIPRSVMAECPPDDQSAVGVAGTAGKILAIAMRPNLYEDGSYANAVAWTPAATGSWNLCGYEDDGAGLTLARSAIAIDVSAPQPAATPAPPAGAAPPAATPAPPPHPGAAPPPLPSTPQPGAAAPPPAQAVAAAPANVARPRVTRAGRRLTCNPGRWSNATGAYAYAWLVNGRPRTGGHTLAVTRSLRGRRVQCSVTAAGAGGRTTVTSAALRVR